MDSRSATALGQFRTSWGHKDLSPMRISTHALFGSKPFTTRPAGSSVWKAAAEIRCEIATSPD